ncbi:MAG: DedA family protein [bacterium]
MLAFVNYLLDLFGQLGYGGIIALMTIESSFIPFPSELVIPPAGYLASQGQFNLTLVILSGTLGSLLGALANYYLAKLLGRTVIYAFAKTKFAKWMLIKPSKIERAEKYFLKYGNISTFIGRLVPGVRQLISIPAGLAKMKLRNFIIYTVLGALIWNTVLAVLGYWMGSNKGMLNQLEYLSLIGFGLFILLLIYIIINHRRKH